MLNHLRKKLLRKKFLNQNQNNGSLFNKNNYDELREQEYLYCTTPVARVPAEINDYDMPGQQNDYEKLPIARRSEEKTSPPPLVTAAIDIGTTNTGYAFSFNYKHKEIYTSKYGGKLTEDRVPTVVLLSPDRKFHSFGYEAEDEYSSLVENGQHREWFYFEKFKMTLYTAKCLTRENTISDSQGRPISAMLIFSMIIEHLRKHAVDIICQSKEDITESDIQWIITVPAIWTDSARQFMKEAAIKAGIDRAKLRLVLEPEAASLFCMEQPSLRIPANCSQALQIARFPVGHKYILADIGGATADICVHQITENGNLREIYKTTGVDIGGSNVDEEFSNFLVKLLGLEVLTKFKQEFMENFQSLMRDFKTKKITFSDATEKVALFLPSSLVDSVKQEMKATIMQRISSEEIFSKSLDFFPRTNKLVLKAELMAQFFKPSIEGVVKILREILTATNDQDIKTLLLVGGYSESVYLRKIIQSEMPGLKVQLVPDVKLAVLKGAVMMGHQPQFITERNAGYSYGFAIMKPFKNGEDPTNLIKVRDGWIYCNKIFAKQIEKGQSLKKGQVFVSETGGRMNLESSKQIILQTELYRSWKTDPKYCLDTDCTLVGKIIMVPPPGGWPSRLNFRTHLIVGETEFTVKVYDNATGAEYQANMDFL